MEPENISLGGRSFTYVGANGTLDRDLYVMAHARHAGLADAQIHEAESPEDYAARLLDLLLTSGHGLLLLGGFLLPEGKRVEDWSEELARETAGFLGRVTDPDQKREVQVQLLSVTLGFFVNGLGSWVATRRASAADAGPTTSPSADGANGTGSSASSPDTTRSAPSGSPAAG